MKGEDLSEIFMRLLHQPETLTQGLGWGLGFRLQTPFGEIGLLYRLGLVVGGSGEHLTENRTLAWF